MLQTEDYKFQRQTRSPNLQSLRARNMNHKSFTQLFWVIVFFFDFPTQCESSYSIRHWFYSKSAFSQFNPQMSCLSKIIEPRTILTVSCPQKFGNALFGRFEHFLRNHHKYLKKCSVTLFLFWILSVSPEKVVLTIEWKWKKRWRWTFESCSLFGLWGLLL
jgi:hypothetical protein